MSVRDDRPYALRRALALRLWGGFYRCPTTGAVLEQIPGDDKVICLCRTSNPLCPTEGTERTGTHRIAYLQPATVDDYLAEGALAGPAVPTPEGEA